MLELFRESRELRFVDSTFFARKDLHRIGKQAERMDVTCQGLLGIVFGLEHFGVLHEQFSEHYGACMPESARIPQVLSEFIGRKSLHCIEWQSDCAKAGCLQLLACLGEKPEASFVDDRSEHGSNLLQQTHDVI